ncbi:hypothetical protein HZB02_06655 [Candidatus Woesearchaeota archaeon]|nr:hypothetical protein [Candidatus Woesearchaeota archaeon]
MMSKCTICDEQAAEYFVKGTPSGYCKECALDTFADLDMLVKAEQNARALQEHLDLDTNDEDPE